MDNMMIVVVVVGAVVVGDDRRMSSISCSISGASRSSPANGSISNSNNDNNNNGVRFTLVIVFPLEVVDWKATKIDNKKRKTVRGSRLEKYQAHQLILYLW